MKTFEPPLEALVGRELTGGAADRQDAGRRVRGAGAADPPDVGRAAARLRQTRLAERPRLAGPDPARRTGASCACASSGPSSGPGRSCCRRDAVEEDETVATARARSLAGARRWRSFAALIDQPRHLHPLLRHQRTSPGSAAPGSTRSSGRRASRRSRRAPSSTTRRSSACTTALHVLGDAIDHYEETLEGEQLPDKAADAAAGPQARGRAVPALRDDDRGGLLLRAPDELLPEGADGGRCSRTAASKLLK